MNFPKFYIEEMDYICIRRIGPKNFYAVSVVFVFESGTQNAADVLLCVVLDASV